MLENKLRVMSVMAHQDDFEMTVGGTFALLRERYENSICIKILTTSRGASGHMDVSTEETFVRRDKEARKSASIIGAEYECLKQLDGSHVEMQVFINHNLLGGLWNAIRDFEPDVIFCPPVINDPLAGIHIDHYNTAMAVRMIAYQLSVPHAYPTVTGKVKRRVALPLIVNVDDVYASTSKYHVSCDISSVYNKKASMLLCHRSQIFEWLPFLAGHNAPETDEEWRNGFYMERHRRMNSWHACDNSVPREYFCITSWGRTCTEEDIQALFPKNIKP